MEKWKAVEKKKQERKAKKSNGVGVKQRRSDESDREKEGSRKQREKK